MFSKEEQMIMEGMWVGQQKRRMKKMMTTVLMYVYLQGLWFCFTIKYPNYLVHSVRIWRVKCISSSG
jgi:hypothetical protein